MKLSSIKVEQSLLGSLIKNSESFYDIDHFISEIDFTNDVNGTIYSIIRQICNAKEKIDKVILAQKIQNLGISFQEDLDIYDYIDCLSLTVSNKDSAIKYAQELKQFSVRRDIKGMAQRIIETVSTNPEKNASQIIAEVDSIYGEKINSFDATEEIRNIFEDIEAFIEEKGNNPQEESGIESHYPEFARLYGGLRNGNVYAIVSRPGQGKSSFLVEMSLGAYLKDKKVSVLYLDTEMFSQDVKLRIAAAKTGVPFWHIDTGNWRKDPEMVFKIRAFLKEFSKYNYTHHCVGNKGIDEIVSFIRRWYYSKVGRGNPALICYDYVKLTGEKVGQNWAEHQAIGEKIDKLKKISEEINAPLFTAMQMNRSGENFNRNAGDVTDDSSAIALSDRLQWFASYVAIFRRKTLDEIERDTPDFGTHKLITLKSRFQGKDAAGHQDLMRRRNDHGDEKYVQNFVNFQINNFSVEERGSLANIIERERQTFSLSDANPNDGTLL